MGWEGGARVEVTATESDDIAKPYRMYFLSYLGFTAQVPNVILNGMNLFCQCGGYVDIILGLGWGGAGAGVEVKTTVSEYILYHSQAE